MACALHRVDRIGGVLAGTLDGVGAVGHTMRQAERLLSPGAEILPDRDASVTLRSFKTGNCAELLIPRFVARQGPARLAK